MTTDEAAVYRKAYRDGRACRDAVGNYRWLATLASPSRLPRLMAITETSLDFELVVGRPAQPDDLVALARHLGDMHGTAHAQELHRAQLTEVYRTSRGHLLPAFPHRRVAAVTRELASGHVPDAALTADQARQLLETADGPAAFYKDANPRNFLITNSGPVTIDFDDLTLAPFGYDLAKLVVTLAMTHGKLSCTLIADALAAYNAAACGRWTGLPIVTWQQFIGWAEIHHILTSRYVADGRYQHGWHQIRPTAAERSWR